MNGICVLGNKLTLNYQNIKTSEVRKITETPL